MHDKYVKELWTVKKKPAIEMMPSATLNIFKIKKKLQQIYA